eukprot:7192092-Pyramimonas_sp.AAC.1
MFSTSNSSLSRCTRSSTVSRHSRQQWQRSLFGLVKNWWRLCRRRSSPLRRAILIWIIEGGDKKGDGRVHAISRIR